MTLVVEDLNRKLTNVHTEVGESIIVVMVKMLELDVQGRTNQDKVTYFNLNKEVVVSWIKKAGRY